LDIDAALSLAMPIPHPRRIPHTFFRLGELHLEPVDLSRLLANLALEVAHQDAHLALRRLDGKLRISHLLLKRLQQKHISSDEGL
jgi:hypothetical protein